MKIGVKFKIDVSKIDKSAIYEGKKGKYITVKSFVNLDEEDQYGNNGMVTQEVGTDKNGGDEPILGNSKVFWRTEKKAEPKPSAPQPTNDFEDDDLPF